MRLSLRNPNPIFKHILLFCLGWVLIGVALPAQASYQHGSAQPTQTPGVYLGTPVWAPAANIFLPLVEYPAPTLTPTATPSPTLTPTVAPSPTPSATRPGSKSIVVNITQQHVYAYEGGRLAYSFIASTGRDDGTATGHFAVLDKERNAWSDPWGFWMPFWMGIYQAGDLENGFHGLPVLPNGLTLWGDQIGTPITYGCVVLRTADMEKLYNWAQVGTPIDIRR